MSKASELSEEIQEKEPRKKPGGLKKLLKGQDWQTAGMGLIAGVILGMAGHSIFLRPIPSYQACQVHAGTHETKVTVLPGYDQESIDLLEFENLNLLEQNEQLKQQIAELTKDGAGLDESVGLIGSASASETLSDIAPSYPTSEASEVLREPLKASDDNVTKEWVLDQIGKSGNSIWKEVSVVKERIKRHSHRENSQVTIKEIESANQE